MSTIFLNPANINATVRRGQAGYFKSGIVTDGAGAALDLSTWDSFSAKLTPQSAGPNTADVSIGTVTGNADGTVTLFMDSTALSSNPTGTANLIISGVHVAADHPQLIASGTFQLLDG